MMKMTSEEMKNAGAEGCLLQGGRGDKRKRDSGARKFHSEDNKFIAITGPNGGGKSTLAKIIAGIEKPTEGRIYLDGEDITDLNITERARKGISYAFQQPVRFKGVTVLDLIRLASGKTLRSPEPVSTFQRWDYVQKTILTGKSMQAFPAGR